MAQKTVVVSRVDQVLEVLQSARQEIIHRGLEPKLTPLQKTLLDRVVDTPLNPLALRDAAFVFLHALGMPDVAKVFFEKAITLDPQSPDLAHWLKVADEACRGLPSSAQEMGIAVQKSHYGQRGVVREKPRVSDIIRKTSRMLRAAEETAAVGEETSRFASSLDMESMTVDQLIAASTSALYEGKLVRAWVNCRRAASLDPQCVSLGPLIQELCNQFLQHSDRTLAVQAYSLARDLHPERVESWLNLGHAFHRAERFTDALNAYADAAKIEPENAMLHSNLSTLYFEMERFDEAEEAARTALQFLPDSAKIWDQLAAALTAQNRLDEAVGACSQGLQHNPDYPELWFKLGVLLFNQGIYADARDAFIKGQQFASGADYTNSYLCLIDVREGRLGEALQRMEKVIEAKKNPPLFWLAWNELMLALLEQEDYVHAFTAGQQAVHFGPENFEAWYNLGIAAHFLNKMSEALSSYKQAVNLQPDCSRAWHNLAVVYSELGDYLQARECLLKVVGFEPENATAYYDLAVAWERSGDDEEAAAAYDRSVELSRGGEGLPRVKSKQGLMDKGMGFIRRFKEGLF